MTSLAQRLLEIAEWNTHSFPTQEDVEFLLRVNEIYREALELAQAYLLEWRPTDAETTIAKAITAANQLANKGGVG